MTNSKSSASYTVAPSIFVIHLVNGAQFLNDTAVSGVVVPKQYHLLLKCKHRSNHKD